VVESISETAVALHANGNGPSPGGKILVTGGTGFVGPRVIHALRAEGRDVRALVRRPERAKQLANWGVELATGDVTDPASVRVAAEGCERVVHLVAILRGRPADFQHVMVDGFRNVLSASAGASVSRVVLMSALGTGEATKDDVPYFGAKWQMEHDLADSGLEHVIFRPSFVFGRDGGALPTFVRQVRLLPIVTVIGNGLQRSEPIWVDDVAAYFARGIDLPEAANRTFELGGPDQVNWNELYLRIAAALGKRRRLVHIPASVARAGARLTQRIPGAPLSADQVTMLEGPDNVVTRTDASDTFRLPLVSLDEQLRRAV
jgi:NADH dehydrogenase